MEFRLCMQLQDWCFCTGWLYFESQMFCWVGFITIFHLPSLLTARVTCLLPQWTWVGCVVTSCDTKWHRLCCHLMVHAWLFHAAVCTLPIATYNDTIDLSDTPPLRHAPFLELHPHAGGQTYSTESGVLNCSGYASAGKQSWSHDHKTITIQNVSCVLVFNQCIIILHNSQHLTSHIAWLDSVRRAITEKPTKGRLCVGTLDWIYCIFFNWTDITCHVVSCNECFLVLLWTWT